MESYVDRLTLTPDLCSFDMPVLSCLRGETMVDLGVDDAIINR